MNDRRQLALVVLLAAVMGTLGLSFGLCLEDDAFITFRYAQNLADGHGLVFNPGERIEGFSNPSWTLILAGARAVGAPIATTAVALGLLSAALILGLAWHLGRPLAGVWALAATALLTLDSAFVITAVMGLETTFFALLVLAGLWLSARELEAGPGGGVHWSGPVLGLAAITRPDGGLIYALCQLWWLLRERRLPSRQRLASWASFLGIFGAWLAFRLAYYGYPFPNTYYVKVGGSGSRFDAAVRGLGYLGDWVQAHPITTLLVLGGLVMCARPRSGPRAHLLAFLTLGWLAYVVAIGGDYMRNFRFVQPVAAPLVVLAAVALAALARRTHWGLALGLVLPTAALDIWPLHQRMADWAEYRVLDVQRRAFTGAWMAQALPPDTWIATHSIGATPFYSGLPTVDMLGLADAHIAHMDWEDLGAGKAGHEKRDPDYVFNQRKPQIYFPEVYLVPDPLKLAIPDEFPASFAEDYERRAVNLGVGWLLLFVRTDMPNPPGQTGVFPEEALRVAPPD